MKINFDWQNFISDNNPQNKAQRAGGMTDAGKALKGPAGDNTFLEISRMIRDDFAYGDQGRFADGLLDTIGARSFVALQRDMMTVMSNSMSAEDFHRMKEEGYQISSMKPEEIVTILDTIKTELAKSGTHVRGYTDTVSVDKMARITGNSGYADAIASELRRAGAPVTEENIHLIDQAVDQALTLTEPGDGNKAYLVSKGMEPTISNLYKAGHSSINITAQVRMTGYASGGYSRYGTDVNDTRKTFVTGQDLEKIEQQIKDRIRESGMEITRDSLQNGKWLVEKGIPVTKENLQLLEQINSLEYPLDIRNVIRQSAIAVSEGRTPFEVNLSQKGESLYLQANSILERYQSLPREAADYVAQQNKPWTLVSMEQYSISVTVTRESIQARKALEEVRLKMTVEANVRLLQSGYSIDTAPMEELIKNLEQATAEWEESLFGTDNAHKKAGIFKEALAAVRELPRLPIAVIGRVPAMKEAGISEVVVQGTILRQQYEAANQSYETMMTAPRYDMGDSIKKAFRNVDDILTDMGLEINEANQRAIRIMGYNQITITEDNLERIKEADNKVRNIINKMKPGLTLEMIREGRNPLEMSMDEIQEYIHNKENDFMESTEKYSEFLYKLEKKNGITESERTAYIGIYRMIRQIEKSDGAAIGSLVAQDAGISFSNLLSAVRSKKARGTDIRVDDSTGGLEKLIQKGASITDQIKAMNEISSDGELNHRLAEEQLKDIRNILKNSSGEREYLEIYKQPVTLDGLQSVNVLNKKRGYTFKKTIELEQDSEGLDAQELENSILEDAKEFLASLEMDEARRKNYDRIIEKSHNVLEESIENRDMSYLDLKELQSVYKQISVAHSLSREENYEVPMQIGEEVTSINLKVIHSTSQYGNVKVTMQTERLGQVEARFVVTENMLEGSILTDYMDGKDILQAKSEDLSKAIEEALEETKVELKGLFFGINSKLDINMPEKGERDSKGDVALLYKVAKSFIRYVKEAANEETTGGKL